jgi:hypothetical protein
LFLSAASWPTAVNPRIVVGSFSPKDLSMGIMNLLEAAARMAAAAAAEKAAEHEAIAVACGR